MRVGPYSTTGMALVFLPLYAGPVLAGLAGHGATVIPVFALLFLLFIAATRRPNLHDTTGWVTLGIMLVVQVALATAGVIAGMLLGTFIGPVSVPLWLPIALTAAASVYGSWSYSSHAEMDVFLDGAIDKIRALDGLPARSPADFHPRPAPEIHNAVAEALDAAHALPADITPRELDPIALRLEKRAGAAAFDPLYDAVAEVALSDPRADLLLLRFVASDRMRRRLQERGEAALPALLLLGANACEVRAEARARLADAIEDGAEGALLPPVGRLEDLDRRFPDEGYDLLARTIATLPKS